MSAPDFGLESLYRLQKINTKQEALVLLVHFVLSKNGWTCLGQGEVWNESDSGSESLPPGWNEQTDHTYRYLSKNQTKFLVQFHVQDRFLFVNLISADPKDDRAVSISINMPQEVEEGLLASNKPRHIFANLEKLINRITEELVKPCEATTRSVGSSTDRPDPLRAGPPHPRGGPPQYPGGYPSNPRIPVGGVPDFGGIGRRDLDPFANVLPGTGGMIIDPLRVPPGLHDPRVPPGARYDPVGPGGIDPEPDNDIFMPPQFPRRFPPGQGGPHGGGFGFGPMG